MFIYCKNDVVYELLYDKYIIDVKVICTSLS